MDRSEVSSWFIVHRLSSIVHRASDLVAATPRGISVVSMRFFLFAASLALAVKLHAVMKDVKAVTVCNPVLERFEGAIFEFNDLSTSKADEMIVVFSLGDPLIPGFSVVKPAFRCQPEPGQELQGSVDGCVANLWIRFDDLGIDLSHVSMAGGVQENMENLLPLPGVLQATPCDQGLEKIGFHRSLHFEIEFQFHFNGAEGFCQPVLPLTRSHISVRIFVWMNS